MKHLALALGAFGAAFGAATTIGTLPLLPAAVSGGIAGAVSSASAQEMDFMAVDADGDGGVTPEEAAAAGWVWTQAQFAAADVDGDGRLSADEFVRATDG